MWSGKATSATNHTAAMTHHTHAREAASGRTTARTTTARLGTTIGAQWFAMSRNRKAVSSTGPWRES